MECTTHQRVTAAIQTLSLILMFISPMTLAHYVIGLEHIELSGIWLHTRLFISKDSLVSLYHRFITQMILVCYWIALWALHLKAGECLLFSGILSGDLSSNYSSLAFRNGLSLPWILNSSTTSQSWRRFRRLSLGVNLVCNNSGIRCGWIVSNYVHFDKRGCVDTYIELPNSNMVCRCCSGMNYFPFVNRARWDVIALLSRNQEAILPFGTISLPSCWQMCRTTSTVK